MICNTEGHCVYGNRFSVRTALVPTCWLDLGLDFLLLPVGSKILSMAMRQIASALALDGCLVAKAISPKKHFGVAHRLIGGIVRRKTDPEHGICGPDIELACA